MKIEEYEMLVKDNNLFILGSQTVPGRKRANKSIKSPGFQMRNSHDYNPSVHSSGVRCDSPVEFWL